jgi:hypothetical protein
MKAKYLLTDRKVQANLEKDEYEVLGFGVVDNKMQPLLIINDLLKVCNFDLTSVKITNKEMLGYVQANEMNYNNEFFIKEDFYQYC